MPARATGTATGGEQRVGRALDALNFFLADVRDGLGPYLAIYLLTVQQWDAASIGVVTSIAGIFTILSQTPAGAWIDRTKAKRGAVIAAAVLVCQGRVRMVGRSAFILQPP